MQKSEISQKFTSTPNETLEKGSVDLLYSNKNEIYEKQKYGMELKNGMIDKNEKDDEIINKTVRSHSDYGIKSNENNFNFDTLTKDLADIEERLRVTRMSWNDNKKVYGNDRKWQSMADVECQMACNNKSVEMMQGSGGADSPALSDCGGTGGLMKWDYCADIGLTQDDSMDEFEPITWPVTAEQAAKEAEQMNGSNRRIKTSASQGSFLSSPDPEDRHNMIIKASAEVAASYGLNHGSTITSHKPPIGPGDYGHKTNLNKEHDLERSAKDVIEEAEAAERRLRQRVENFKANHFNGSSKNETISMNPGNFDTNENVNIKHNDENTLDQKDGSSSGNEQMKQISCDEKSVGSNTGRTSTLESTHTYSDYGKAPQFSLSAYGSREESLPGAQAMYARLNKNYSNGVLGMPTELETISSRETLNLIPDQEEKRLNKNIPEKDGVVTNTKKDESFLNRDLNERNEKYKYEAPRPVGPVVPPIPIPTNLSNHVLSGPNSGHRQNSTATTFTSITTNYSPRQLADSFDTDYVGSPRGGGTTVVSALTRHSTFPPQTQQPSLQHEHPQPLQDGGESKNKSGSRGHSTSPERQHNSTRVSATHYNYSGSKPYSNHRYSDDDDDDEDDDKYRRSRDIDEKRKERHKSAAEAYKKLQQSRGITKKQSTRQKYQQTDTNIGGETTASELEHDDEKQVDKGDRKKLAKLLKKLHNDNNGRRKRGQQYSQEDDEGSGEQSTSVDTVLIMERMAALLEKKNKREETINQPINSEYNIPRKSASRQNSRTRITENPPINGQRRDKYEDNRIKNPRIDSEQLRKQELDYRSQKSRIDPNQQLDYGNEKQRIILEGNESGLLLKHLLLKHKVKWLADCAREETRRRKIRKLEKLLDYYENDNQQIILPDDLQTDTATLIGSDRGSFIYDQNSDSESWSYHSDQYYDSLPPPPPPPPPPTQAYPVDQHPCYPYPEMEGEHHNWDQTTGTSFRQQYSDYKKIKNQRYIEKEGGNKEGPIDDSHKRLNKTEQRRKKEKKIMYPPSQTWNIPLNESEHVNDARYGTEGYMYSGDGALNANQCNEYYPDYEEYAIPRINQKSQVYPSKQFYQDEKFIPRISQNQQKAQYCYEDEEQYYSRYPSQKYMTPKEYNDSKRHSSSRKSERSSHNGLSLRERIQVIRESDMARQRNAHEVEKDLRQTQTKSTKVANGGLAWVVGSDKSGGSHEKNDEFNNQSGGQYNGHKPSKSDLQLAFEERMNNFISRSQQRQKRIKLAADERRYQIQMNQERNKLFSETPQTLQDAISSNNHSFRRRRPITQPDPLSDMEKNGQNVVGNSNVIIPKLKLKQKQQNGYSNISGRYRNNAEHLYKPQPRRFSRTEIINNSARKYRNLPEMQQKYSDERKKARIQHNRMKMMQYSEKILNQVLRSRGPWISEKST